jgi:hypothetical protein
LNDLERLLQRIIRDLRDQGAAAALVGGIAVSIRTEPRFTRDVDLAVAVENDIEAEAVVAAVSERGCRGSEYPWRVSAT